MEPIRILHVVTYMGRGGLETMIMNYYRHIDRSKLQFDFLVHRVERADYDDEIEAMGGVIYRLPRLVPWSRSYKKALNDFFADHQEYQIVHVHQDCLSSVILKAAERHTVQVRIAHSHSSSQDKNLKYLVKLFYRRQIPKYATDLFACSKDAGSWMFCGAPFHIVNNAIDAKKYIYSQEVHNTMRTHLGISEDQLVVGHVGRFNQVKNHTFLLDVFAKLIELDVNAVLLLVGDGELRVHIEKKASKLGLSGKVIFTGSRPDVQDLLQAMDVFVFPSLYEGMGIAAIEAQASGLPCIVSDATPRDVAITPSVVFRPLKDTPEQWAEDILVMQKASKRENSYISFCLAGYDIEKNAQWLENYYLEHWNENE